MTSEVAIKTGAEDVTLACEHDAEESSKKEGNEELDAR
jgi:hypothetical protein